MSRTIQSDAGQQDFLKVLKAEEAIVEDMQQIAARATDSAARGLFEHLGRAGRNVFFVKGVGLINVHVRTELRGWWAVLKSVKALEDAGETSLSYLSRHSTGDWGKLSDEDKYENDMSITRDLRILSAYKLSTGTKIWIITEADRSSTCILLPSEY